MFGEIKNKDIERLENKLLIQEKKIEKLQQDIVEFKKYMLRENQNQNKGKQ